MLCSGKTDSGKLLLYKNLGIYKVLLTLTDKDAVLEYIKDTVLPLYDYDKMNHTDLVKVLRCYLENDCSVKETAQELIVHRNTVNYKIGKVSEILKKDLSGFDIRFQLNLGSLLYQMYEEDIDVYYRQPVWRVVYDSDKTKASGSQVNVNRALFFILSKNKFVYRKTNLKNK